MLIKGDFDRVFSTPNVLDMSPQHFEKGVDVLLHPSAIRSAPPLAENDTGSIDTYVQDVLTVPASLAGLPALGVPAGFAEDGWPVGVSVVGQWGCEELVMAVGEKIQHRS
jgi:aspartyl-tRNA(Asn)/glutamyl-tRNA(Gln) amidotransferase subunit A